MKRSLHNFMTYRLDRKYVWYQYRIKALPYVDYVDIDVELPDNDMELDSQLKPMVRSFHSSLSPNSVRFQSAVNCTKRHNASKCIEVRQNHALVEQGKRMR